MDRRTIPNTDLLCSRIAFGCASLAAWDSHALCEGDLVRTNRMIDAALEAGVTLFDNADTYAFGKCEEALGKVLKQRPGLREKIILQSKCGQKLREGGLAAPIRVDLSKEHILRAARGTIRRLVADRIDILLLHAPDALMQPDEVAAAFDELHQNGDVRYFGVSNFNAAQIGLLRKSVRQPIVVNQIQISLARPHELVDGMALTLRLANGRSLGPSAPVAGTVDYCRTHDIQLQAFSPLRGIMTPDAGSSSDLTQTLQRLDDLARAKGVTRSAVAIAWLLRHPAGIIPVLGSVDPKHLLENCVAARLSLSREEWYDLFVAAALANLSAREP